jgi:hypothetical protein
VLGYCVEDAIDICSAITASQKSEIKGNTNRFFCDGFSGFFLFLDTIAVIVAPSAVKVGVFTHRAGFCHVESSVKQ